MGYYMILCCSGIHLTCWTRLGYRCTGERISAHHHAIHQAHSDALNCSSRHIGVNIYVYPRTGDIVGDCPLFGAREYHRCYDTEVMLYQYPPLNPRPHAPAYRTPRLAISLARPSRIPTVGIYVGRLLSTDPMVRILPPRTISRNSQYTI